MRFGSSEPVSRAHFCSGVRPADAHADGKAGQGSGRRRDCCAFLAAVLCSEMTRNVQLSYRVMMAGLGLSGSLAGGRVRCLRRLPARRRRRGRRHRLRCHQPGKQPKHPHSCRAGGTGRRRHCKDHSSLTCLPGVSRGRAESLSSTFAQPSEQPKQMQAARWCPRQ